MYAIHFEKKTFKPNKKSNIVFSIHKKDMKKDTVYLNNIYHIYITILLRQKILKNYTYERLYK